MSEETVLLKPQKGPQTDFLSSPADIVVYGGAAGGGKTWGLLLEPLRHIYNPNFRAVIFRRTFPQVTNPGGLWDETQKVYPALGAVGRENSLEWTFPSGAEIKFAHLQHEKNKYDWQGAQIALLEFDELTHFLQSQFFYLMSRARSVSGVRPYVRATTNPDADSWVKTLIAPWVDEEHPEFPFPPGKLKWMTVENDTIVFVPKSWRDESGIPGRSITFIPSSVYDNKILLSRDPNYLASLRALPYVEQQRLLYGSWSVRAEAGKVFNRTWFEVLDVAPVGPSVSVRFWDFAATEVENKGDDPDWTVGCRVRRLSNGIYIIEDVFRDRLSPGQVDEAVMAIASQDGKGVVIAWEEEGGSAGKRVSHHMRQMLHGYTLRAVRSASDKVTRAGPAASQAYGRNIKLLRGMWNDPFLSEIHSFPDADHDDQVDGLSGAVNAIVDLGSESYGTASAVSREQVESLFFGMDGSRMTSVDPVLERLFS